MKKDRKAIPTATRAKRTRGVGSGLCNVAIGSTYTEMELDFLKAVDAYKRNNQRPFPSWSEVLAILISLGYRRVAEPTPI
jgi:hypothetical protein